MNESREDDVGFMLKQIHDGICRGANNDLRPMDLTLSQMRVIMFLSRQATGDATQKDIEARFGVSHPTVVGIVKRLESKNMVHGEVDPNDRRMKRICLTQQGRQFADNAKTHRGEMEKTLTGGLTEEEVAQLRHLLGRLIRNVSQAGPGGEKDAHGR